MKKQTALFTAQATVLGLLFALSGCTGSSSDSTASTGPMFIVSCSLGCGSAATGIPVTCGLVNISQNAELTIRFSEPVDLSTVTSASFRLVNLDNGTVPEGVFTLDPADPRRLVFRPGLTFTGAGIPEFAFGPNETFQLTLQGSNTGSTGPFIRSTGGKINTTLMDCTLQTTEPLVDPVPGSPTITPYITSTLDPGTGTVLFDDVTHLPVGGELMAGITDVPLNSRVVLLIDDIMNKSTVANQLTGQSSTMTIRRMNTNGGSSAQEGRWDVIVDNDILLRTTAIFTPTTNTIDPNTGLADTSFLTAGGDAMNPQPMILTLSNQIVDVVGNGIQNPGTTTFTTIIASFAEQALTEDFTTGNNEDVVASGGDWGSGLLTHGLGGGSGRLGPLRLESGEILTLSTTSQVFPFPAGTNNTAQLQGILSNVDPASYDALDDTTWPTVTIDTIGEAFEFSDVAIDSSAILLLTGDEPGRIFSRGNILHNGVLDLSGTTPPAHVSNSGTSKPGNVGVMFNGDLYLGLDTARGGTGANGGPNAGSGGNGADRLNVDVALGSTVPMEALGGIVWDAPTLADGNPEQDGQPGMGVGGVDNGGTVAATGGIGGEHWPPTMPKSTQSSQTALFGDLETTEMTGMDTVETNPGLAHCRVAMVAGPGSGGAYALPGDVGRPETEFSGTAHYPGLLNQFDTPTPGGDNSPLGLEVPSTNASVTNLRNLEFWRGNLQGGSGGGGGGLSVYGSRNNSSDSTTLCNNGSWALFPFWDHSAAGGGGGGGAVMMVAGRNLLINGTIDCTGGEGGSSTELGSVPLDCSRYGAANTTVPPNCEKMAAPGGGGSGGVILLQGREVTIGGSSANLLVDGGMGGIGVGGSMGGDGSPGLVRIEHGDFTTHADGIATYAPEVIPAVSDINDPFNQPFKSAAILSVGKWRDTTGNFPEYAEFRPESYSGSQSCWMSASATAGAVGLSFVADTPATTDPALFGWNMDIMFQTTNNGIQRFPYRGIPPMGIDDGYDETVFNDVMGPLLGGMDFETFMGTTLNHDEAVNSAGAYVAVRFQGVFASLATLSPCNLNLEGSNSTAIPGSLTPFVSRPEFLNAFPVKPNLIRFAVVFDESLLGHDAIVARQITGITNLRIRIQPE